MVKSPINLDALGLVLCADDDAGHGPLGADDTLAVRGPLEADELVGLGDALDDVGIADPEAIEAAEAFDAEGAAAVLGELALLARVDGPAAAVPDVAGDLPAVVLQRAAVLRGLVDNLAVLDLVAGPLPDLGGPNIGEVLDRHLAAVHEDGHGGRSRGEGGDDLLGDGAVVDYGRVGGQGGNYRVRDWSVGELLGREGHRFGSDGLGELGGGGHRRDGGGPSGGVLLGHGGQGVDGSREDGRDQGDRGEQGLERSHCDEISRAMQM